VGRPDSGRVRGAWRPGSRPERVVTERSCRSVDPPWGGSRQNELETPAEFGQDVAIPLVAKGANIRRQHGRHLQESRAPLSVVEAGDFVQIETLVRPGIDAAGGHLGPQSRGC
jgi:hypothetical protein